MKKVANKKNKKKLKSGLKAKKASNYVKVSKKWAEELERAKYQQHMKIGRARSKRAQGKVNFVNLKMYITLLFKQTIGCTKHEKLDQWTDLRVWGYFLMQNKSQQITSIEEIL